MNHFTIHLKHYKSTILQFKKKKKNKKKTCREPVQYLAHSRHLVLTCMLNE